MRRIIIPLLFGVIGAAILLSLGSWQIQRLAWKQGVLTEIGSRINGAPIPLPDQPDVNTHRYSPVELTGHVEAEELRVLTSRKRVGPGHLIISAFVTDQGRRILLDRGFVKAQDRDAPRPSGPAVIRGNINWPDDRTSSTPDNDVAGNIWYARDVTAMAQRLDTEPLMVILASSDTDLGTTPLPVDTTAVPNDHLEYAITWFSLAVIWLAMTGFLIYRIRKQEA